MQGPCPLDSRMKQLPGKDSLEMPFALNLIYAAALVVFSPLICYRWLRAGKYREGWVEKLLGKAPLRIGDHPCFWFHAVSVGEVLLLRPLVREMARRRPNWQVVISTSTSTGLAVARRTYPDLVTFYAPLDFSWSTRRADRTDPSDGPGACRAGALAQLDPGRQAIRCQGRDHQCPAQPAELSGLPQPAAARCSRPWAASTSWLRRTRNTPGGSSTWEFPVIAISVTGSVKYDGLESDRNNAKTRELRQLLGLAPTDLVFVAGSTMEGEEAAVLAAYNTARRQHRGLRLILVPRHAERFDDGGAHGSSSKARRSSAAAS